MDVFVLSPYLPGRERYLRRGTKLCCFDHWSCNSWDWFIGDLLWGVHNHCEMYATREEEYIQRTGRSDFHGGQRWRAFDR